MMYVTSSFSHRNDGFDMELKNMRVGDLAEKTGLSVDTIKNMRNNPAKAIKIEELVAVCIALHLSRETIIEYINRAPNSFCETDEDNCFSAHRKSIPSLKEIPTKRC